MIRASTVSGLPSLYPWRIIASPQIATLSIRKAKTLSALLLTAMKRQGLYFHWAELRMTEIIIGLRNEMGGI